MVPFAFFPHATHQVTLGVTSTEVSLVPNCEQVWIDNRGDTDVLVEFLSAPLDADSFRIAPYTAQPLTTPKTGGSWDVKVRLKRPAGATAALVVVTSGEGF